MTEELPDSAANPFRFQIRMWYPNTTMEPQKFGMNDLMAAINTAIAIAGDGTWHNITVVDTINGMEWAHVASHKWYRGLAPNAQITPPAEMPEARDNGED